MYLDNFKLNEYPFQLTPDSDFLYMSEPHARAKAYMDYTIWNRDGFVAITGEVGSGKTTLIQKLLSELDDNVLVAKLFQTQLDDVEFLQAVLNEFGLQPFHAKKPELLNMLDTFLLDSYMQGKQLVLIVDEAQNLGNRVLEEIRMLSGLETRKEKILHVILVGQPELKEKLESPEMEQLLQRIRLKFHLRALMPNETKDYILHRLKIAGAQEDGIFVEETFPLIYQYTGGVPRLINTLCDTALTCAFADGLSGVSVTVVQAAIKELQWLPYNKRVKPRPAGREAIPANKQELFQLLRDNRQHVESLNGKISRVDGLIPMLMTFADRMRKLEVQLKRIADQLEPTNPSGKVQYLKKSNK